MRRIIIPTILVILAALLPAGAGHARLIKEMQVTRSGKVGTTVMNEATVYGLMLPNKKTVLIGDRAFFPPSTQTLLDQAAQQGLIVKVTGQLLIHSSQPAVFSLPLDSLELATPAGSGQDQPQSQKTAKTPSTRNTGRAE